MRATPFLFSVLGATLISAGAVSAHAADVYYNPTNKASPTGYTTDYEDFRTIGCPGKQILDVPCKVPDTDQDGVTDDNDKCPNTPAGRKVNAEGCELDSDGDGVVDGLDKCPGTPKGRKVNASGCEMDTDTDGIVDAVDKCPTIYAKTADGCPPPPEPVAEPAPAAAPQKLVLGDVLFAYNESTLTDNAVETLDKAVASLQQWGNVKVEVAGYTDATGSETYNDGLSMRRAEAVRTYLIGKGIAADRLTAKGYGEANPVASNDTDEGRAQNRRVELVPMQ